jgi:hypothetical protein
VPKGAIVAPNKASKATIVAATIKDSVKKEGFNAYLKDTFKSLS